MVISIITIISVLFYILFIIVQKGFPSLSWEMVSKVPSGGYYLGKEGGILNAIVGSLLLMVGSVIISLAISLPVALYINFIIHKSSKLSNLLRFTFDILFGIPSIVYGAFGFMLMIYFGIQASLLGGIIAVSFLIIPILVRSIDEVAGFVPKELIEALQSLGATRFEILKVVVKQIAPGITTAIILAFGRGIGDASTVLFTAGFTDSIPTSLSQPAATLPLAIFFQLGSPIAEVQNRAYSAALILTVIILALSLSARFINSKISKSNL